MYKRKTKTVYVLQVNYGYGNAWEDEITEETREDIRERAKEYRENCRQYPNRIITRREKLATE